DLNVHVTVSRNDSPQCTVMRRPMRARARCVLCIRSGGAGSRRALFLMLILSMLIFLLVGDVKVRFALYRIRGRQLAGRILPRGLAACAVIGSTCAQYEQRCTRCDRASHSSLL